MEEDVTEQGSLIVMDMMSPQSKRNQVAALNCQKSGDHSYHETSKVKKAAERT